MFSGGGIFGVFGKQVNRFGRIPVIFLGLVANMLAFVLIFINIPFAAPVAETSDTSYISAKHVFSSKFIIYAIKYFISVSIWHCFAVFYLDLQMLVGIRKYAWFLFCYINPITLYVFHSDLFVVEHKLYERQCCCIWTLQIVPGLSADYNIFPFLYFLIYRLAQHVLVTFTVVMANFTCNGNY